MSHASGTGGSTPLSGGRLTPGVVRVGDTVRRPAGDGTSLRLLAHLEAVGFDGAPRHLGIDEEGRHVLSYLEGETFPRWRRWEDAQVIAAARLLRAFHNATAGHAIADGHEVVCHGDPGSNNAIFLEGRPVAWIDFDLARPGRRIDDVAYLAWSWCLSSSPARGTAAEQALQLGLIADAYGLAVADRAGLVDAIVERQGRNARWWSERRRTQVVPSGPPTEEVVRWSLRERDFTEAHRDVLVAALEGVTRPVRPPDVV